nr:hypothetical protein [Tanacetum cinerariifolium]
MSPSKRKFRWGIMRSTRIKRSIDPISGCKIWHTNRKCRIPIDIYPCKVEERMTIKKVGDQTIRLIWRRRIDKEGNFLCFKNTTPRMKKKKSWVSTLLTTNMDSFISTKFAPLLNEKPSIANPGYVIEVANGKNEEVDRIFCGYRLELEDSIFPIDFVTPPNEAWTEYVGGMVRWWCRDDGDDDGDKGGVETVVMGRGLWWWCVVKMMMLGCSWWCGVNGDDVIGGGTDVGAWEPTPAPNVESHIKNFVSIRNTYCLLVRTITAWLSTNQSIQIMTSKLPSPMCIKAMLKGVSKGLRILRKAMNMIFLELGLGYLK